MIIAFPHFFHHFFPKKSTKPFSQNPAPFLKIFRRFSKKKFKKSQKKICQIAPPRLAVAVWFLRSLMNGFTLVNFVSAFQRAKDDLHIVFIL